MHFTLPEGHPVVGLLQFTENGLMQAVAESRAFVLLNYFNMLDGRYWIECLSFQIFHFAAVDVRKKHKEVIFLDDF